MGGDANKFEGFRVKISQDQLTAWLVIEPGADRTALSEEGVDAVCADRGVISQQDRSRVIREAIEEFFSVEERETPFEVVIAKGRPPQHGVDSHLQFEPGLDPFEEEEEEGGLKVPEGQEPDAPPQADGEEEEEAVDFYNQSAFTIVAPNQLIGRIIDPTEGVDGYDVTGKALGARNGRALDLKVDSSISVDRDQRLIAQTSGIIDYTGTRIRVLDQLDIANNVDFSTGNINFPGDVNVGKGVKDCFNVKVGKSLIVRELVEAASINVAVDCTIHRGMAGRGKGSITTGRDLCATYIDNTTILVGRDLIIAKEISACTTTVSRSVVSAGAALVGGVLTAGSKVDIGQVGSESGAKTLLVLGRLGEIDLFARRLAEMLPDADLKAKRLRKRRETLTAQGPNLTPEQAEELATLQRTAPEAEMCVSRIRSGLERLWYTHQENTCAELIVHRMLYSGVQIAIGSCIATMREDLKGPVRIWLAKGEPRVGESSGEGAPLSSVASIEASDRFPDLKALAEPPDLAKAA